MHGQHPDLVIDLCILFINVVGMMLGNHARADVMPSKWPIEMALAVAVGHHNGVAQAFTLEQMHQGKGLRAGGVYLLL